MSLYKIGGKRAFDILTASIAGLILLLLLLLIAALVAVKLGRPVLFHQERTGYGRRRFKIAKFRSMLDATDASGMPLPDEQRLTPFGRWLRSWSLDELPSLWNIITGDLSIVGPRPILPQYDPLYSDYQARRFEVRPGVTGWAQINGRNSISWPQKFALDVWYVENQSFLIDLKIIALTVIRVLARHGINADDAATMPFFSGERGEEPPGGSKFID